MVPKTVPLLIFVTAAVALPAAAAAALGEKRVGRWEEIRDLELPTLMEKANFAVNTYNKKKKAHLKFERILRARFMIMAEELLLLDIAARDDGEVSRKYKALVHNMPSSCWLEFFRKINE
ncbi:cysteine proteinase inhibitor 5-like [Andrographis paniculata]|uniref:cysteine proteinase inhibitor 5-like n=1 Tax=Andrographis paniculata TaxID=175694 RepID=UPI0021E71923|nr:cysteine proteinase inhibitor 5-like [Andrographis paniculata]